MAYTTINKPTLHHSAKLYTGTGSSNSVTGLGFQPDWIWIKDRGNTFSQTWTDAVRGTSKELYTNNNSAETSYSQGVTSFDSNGFTLGTDAGVNSNGGNKVSWNWKGGNGTASNSNGTITSTVSANTTAGFSIVSYTANGTQGATVGHGLSSAPEMVITKDRSATGSWGVYHVGQHPTSPEDYYLEMNSTNTANDFTYWNDAKPSNTVVTLGNAAANNTNGRNIIMYCFHTVAGYSKVGAYKGNGESDGTFIYTGFKPAFVMIKGAISGDGDAAQSWEMYDNKREGFNPTNDALHPNTNSAEGSSNRVDLYSNGFRAVINSDGVNDDTSTYVYLAFAEAPLVGTNNIPATAR